MRTMTLRNAAIVNAAGRYVKVILAVLLNAVLARLLSPDDFGVMAIVMVFTTLFASVSDMGFGTAIVQKKDLTDEEIDDIFSFSVYCAIVLTVAFFFCGFPIAYFYQNTEYVGLCHLLSLSLFFSAANMVPNGLMNRNKKFVSLAKRTVVTYAVSAIVAVMLALFGAGCYALALQSLVLSVSGFLWNYFTVKPHFYWRPNMANILKVSHYSGFQFAFNIVTYLSDNLSSILSGRFFGAIDLGYFNRAFTLANYPVSNIAGVITPVLHPILSDYQQNHERIYRYFIKTSKLLGYVGAFVMVLFVSSSREVVLLFYGDSWGGAVACFRFLSLAILPMMMNAVVGSIFQALGNTKVLFLNSCINSCVTAVATCVGVFVGGSVESLSLYLGISRYAHLLTAYYMLIKYGFNYKLGQFAKSYSWLLAALVLSCGATISWDALGVLENELLISFVIKCFIISIGFVPSVFFGDRSLFSAIISRRGAK